MLWPMTDAAETEHRVKRRPSNMSGEGQLARQRERQAKALELRKAGATYAQIAKRLGYTSPQGAASSIKRALDRMIQEPAEEVRKMEYERLNHILLVLWPRVQIGELPAIDRAMRVMERIALLMGVHHQAPETQNVQNNVIVIDGDNAGYVEALKSLKKSAESALVASDEEPEVIEAEVVGT